MNTNPIIERVKKLMALADAERGGTEAERQVAFQKASALMAAHGLSQAEISLHGDSEGTAEEMIKDELKHTQAKPKSEHRALYRILLHCFNVRLVVSRGYKSLNTFVMGEVSDVQLAQHAWEFLYAALNKGYREFLHSSGRTHKRATKTAYFHGASEGFIRAWDEGRRQAEQQAQADVVQCYAVALRDKRAALVAFEQSQFENLRSARASRTKGDWEANAAGFEKGRTLNVRRPVGNGAAGANALRA